MIIPESVAAKTPKPQAWVTTLYLAPKTPQSGVWDDPVLSAGDDTLTPTGIRNNARAGDFWNDAAKIGLITDTLYLPFRPGQTDPDRLRDDLRFAEQVRKVVPQGRVKNLLPLLNQMRWAKTPAETEVMRRACAIVAEAFREAARTATRLGTTHFHAEGIVNAFQRAVEPPKAISNGAPWATDQILWAAFAKRIPSAPSTECRSRSTGGPSAAAHPSGCPTGSMEESVRSNSIAHP